VSLLEGSALIALGSDTGGSIRIPAAFTGTVGPRTTRGRWPTDGVVPLSHTFDTVGALTRTVEDSIYFFGTIDPEWDDPSALAERLGAIDLNGVRIAIPRSGIWGDCQTDIRDVLETTLGELEAAGTGLCEIEGELLDDAFQFSMGIRPIVATECRAFLEEKLPEWLEILHPIVASRLEDAPSPGDSRYTDAIAEQGVLAKRSEELFEDADVLALPANIITPPPVEELDDLERYALANSAILRPTYPISVLGLCAISIPAGLDEEGMPVGLQLVARSGEDERLLGIARAAERVLGTARERLGTPPLPPPTSDTR
jgi:aspartyl-tRNA(Asn)/glutamyl-tRNA(Gln) amidotransferase subunit A